jgi:hypothetical protein
MESLILHTKSPFQQQQPESDKSIPAQPTYQYQMKRRMVRIRIRQLQTLGYDVICDKTLLKFHKAFLLPQQICESYLLHYDLLMPPMYEAYKNSH